MLQLLNQYFRNRTVWILLFLSTAILFLIALYFQYMMSLEPCVLCIYQRCALLGIMLSALIAIVAPNSVIFRFTALVLWIYSGFRGFDWAHQQAILHTDPYTFHACPLTTEFPHWFPLDNWLPAVFESRGACSENTWKLLTLDVSQWMMLVFALYSFIGILVFISQLFRLPQRKTWRY